MDPIAIASQEGLLIMSMKWSAVSGVSERAAASVEADHTGAPVADTAVSIGGSDPDSAAAPTGTTAGEPTESALSWLGDAVITGLMHCACSYQSVHPDFISLVNGETQPALPQSHGSDEDDAV